MQLENEFQNEKSIDYNHLDHLFTRHQFHFNRNFGFKSNWYKLHWKKFKVFNGDFLPDLWFQFFYSDEHLIVERIALHVQCNKLFIRWQHDLHCNVNWRLNGSLKCRQPNVNVIWWNMNDAFNGVLDSLFEIEGGQLQTVNNSYYEDL